MKRRRSMIAAWRRLTPRPDTSRSFGRRRMMNSVCLRGDEPPAEQRQAASARLAAGLRSAASGLGWNDVDHFSDRSARNNDT